ncbi:RuBisCO large subunit C-terminal-like domain-containing protein [Gemmatimonas sp.]|jgi:ribulose-bisphosphate carboxylase large chain|uniref:RuBisCO large subunit C-terminal-like domain-containing protein n=1 Tax=Gemmatimonas sp. TaxID=1962908 RepID=UPI0022C86693|nr:RuBisCO large subunit C-terminal-like domain-containing protein [Gemmatimonas sp.]MCZ8206055.1 RuBisCO large subunit C-terminal-like domain-containing protein [Gemmatimonas sp.]
MQPHDIDAFFAPRASLDMEAYLELTFTFECAGDPRAAAAHLASEQSTAQWRRVGVHEDFRPQHAAKVLELDAMPQPAFSVPLRVIPPGPVHRCRVVIAHPHGNFGARLPNLISAVLGEGVYFAPGIPLIRLEDIGFPASYLAHFDGPQFGVAGVRERLQVHGRPLFFGVIKPNIGLAPTDFAPLGYEGWMGGLDIAKDDEMLADAPYSPLAERAALLGALRARAEQETGVPKGFLCNITDEVDRIAALHDTAVAAGANLVMVNAMPVGVSGVRALRRVARVPIVTHFPFIAAFGRLPSHGAHSRVFTRLQRLAGADIVIMPGFGDRMMTPPSEVLENVRACLEPMGPLKPSLPVPGGSDSAATLEAVYRRVGTVDFGFVPGRGVFAHPMGPRAGAASLQQAWAAIAAGVPVEVHARQHPELRAALSAFGPAQHAAGE